MTTHNIIASKNNFPKLGELNTTNCDKNDNGTLITLYAYSNNEQVSVLINVPDDNRNLLLERRISHINMVTIVNLLSSLDTNTDDKYMNIIYRLVNENL